MERLWPVVAMTCGLAIGAAAFGTRLRYWGSITEHKITKTVHNSPERDNCRVLPRLCLIEGLLENVEMLELEMESRKHDHIASRLCEILDAVKQELECLDARDGKGRSRSMQVIDAKMVGFLSAVFAETDMGSILQAYLPRIGQTWNSFLQDKSKEEHHFFDLENRKDFPHAELKEYFLASVEKLKSSLEQSIAQDLTDFNRKTGDEEEVQAIIPMRYQRVRILYATDRQVTTNGEYIGSISKRSPSLPLHYGWVEVGIPDIHEIGYLEAPTGSREEADPCKHVVVLSINTSPRGNFNLFVECIDEDRAMCGDGTGELLIYIHGYNARHLDSIKKVAQFKHDLKFKGTVILYSWSSKGTMSRYATDESRVRKAALSLGPFLRHVMQEVKAPRAHIVAHSMGTRALVGALIQNLDAPQIGGCHISCPLSQIVLVAADEERRRFENLVRILNERYKSTPHDDHEGIATIIQDTRPHLTLYCSTGDWPLALSKVVHNLVPRLGDTQSLFHLESDTTLSGYDVIDASSTEGSSFKHHSYHLESPAVIQDIGNLLAQRTPPSSRSNLNLIRKRGIEFYAFSKSIRT